MNAPAPRGEPLIAVHAWEPSGPPVAYVYVPPDADELAIARRAARVKLAAAIAGIKDSYPSVEVEQRVDPDVEPRAVGDRRLGAHGSGGGGEADGDPDRADEKWHDEIQQMI